MKIKNAGFTLISVLISLAVASIGALAIMSLMNLTSHLYSQNQGISFADTIQQTTAGIISNPDQCAAAFTRGGNPVPFPGAGAEGTAPMSIPIDAVNINTKPIYAVGSIIGPGVQLTAISFDEPIVPGVGNETSPNFEVRGTITSNGVDYRTFVGYITFQFKSTGGVLAPRQVPITVAVANTTNRITKCYAQVNLEQLCTTMHGLINPVTHKCDISSFGDLKSKDCNSTNSGTCSGSPNGQPCAPVYYISGTDSNAQPKCACILSCDPVPVPTLVPNPVNVYVPNPIFVPNPIPNPIPVPFPVPGPPGPPVPVPVPGVGAGAGAGAGAGFGGGK